MKTCQWFECSGWISIQEASFKVFVGVDYKVLDVIDEHGLKINDDEKRTNNFFTACYPRRKGTLGHTRGHLRFF
jgi:hypothetical protein